MCDHELSAPATDKLEEMHQQNSDLNKWREIFSFHGLEISNTTHQRGQGSDGDGPPAAGKHHPPSTVPKPFLLSPDTGGQPISLEMATGLRKLLFGNLFHLFSCEWEKAYFRFHEPYSDLAYALEAEKWGPRAILMAVQAHIIKYLLFVRNTEYTHLERLCRINRREQGEALAAALADTLWAAGEGGRAVICLVTAAIHVMPSRGYKADNFTERIQLFEFSEKAAAQEFIFDHINCVSMGYLLYSELPCCLLTSYFPFESFRANSCAQRRAVPLSQVCPRLRTPRLPIWLCSVSGRYSVLFGTDSQLLSDWKMERVFHLYFYSGQQEQRKTARLTIDTHSHHWEKDQSEDPSSPGKRRPSVEMAIRTKWAGATVNWNGTDPFF
ncbi:inactive ubiquitin carboxyl-terminal hydrolase MINDY-4B [Falco rusticolus]|uniref:inactive ubiquitin carboxyl-terminal hydrolase MINDY-4B n=1 Tax=Falco rusticolus TaxID=120794 RepID=UPI001886604C|nr:inactive ubiquitin carboxyl-terminal hydrolase MINDY-4B [Falco rusticolus]